MLVESTCSNHCFIFFITNKQIQSILDKAGYIPGVGNVASGINAGIHAARGNWKEAGWAAAGALPGGQLVKGIRLSRNVLKQVLRGSKRIRKKNKWKRGKEGWTLVGIRAKERQTYRDALKDFSRLVDKSSIKRFRNKAGKIGYEGTMRNGYQVKVRSWSSDGRPTLEINRRTPTGDLKKLEMRYGKESEGNQRRRG